jgi:hypothetical protein
VKNIASHIALEAGRIIGRMRVCFHLKRKKCQTKNRRTLSIWYEHCAFQSYLATCPVNIAFFDAAQALLQIQLGQHVDDANEEGNAPNLAPIHLVDVCIVSFSDYD